MSNLPAILAKPLPRAVGALRRIAFFRHNYLLKAANETSTPVRKKPSYDFSLTGLVYCSMMMFMGMAAMNSHANLLYGVFGLMIGILLISGVICRLVLVKLFAERVLPEYPIVGQATTIQYHFTNRKRYWPSLSVCLAELEGTEAFTKQPHAYMLHAAPGMTAVVPVELLPKRRGLHHLGTFQLSTSFPFGFIKRALERKKDDALLIYPAVGSVSPRLLSLCRSAERSGANMKPRPGGQDEFYGVKEFRSGENPRWIHWKRTARTGQLVAKEMTHVSPPRLMILVDTYIKDRTPREYAAVERAIAMAASLASKALESEMAVGLCVWTGDFSVIPPLRGKRHCRDILAALAELPANHSVPAENLVGHSKAMVRMGSTPILFTPQEIELSLSEHARGGFLVVSANSEQARSWFQFDPRVDFTRCMPADQQPALHEPSVNSLRHSSGQAGQESVESGK